MTIKTAQGSQRPTAKLVPILVSALLLAACGGGGDKELHTDVYKATTQASDPAGLPVGATSSLVMKEYAHPLGTPGKNSASTLAASKPEMGPTSRPDPT